MMSCPSETDWVRWMAGEISEVQRHSMESHADKCPVCTRRRQKLQAIWRLTGTWQVDAAARDVLDGVFKAVRQQPAAVPPARRYQPWVWPVPLRAAAGILLAAGIGWSAGRLAPAHFPMTNPPVAATTEPVTDELAANEISLDALTGGTPTGLAFTFLSDEPEPSTQETKG
jgi:anti-sigma factor RsiW